MGTTGSVDGAGRLVIRGRFQQKQIENVLRRYMGKLYLHLDISISSSKIYVSPLKKSNMSPARPANLLTLFSQKKTVSSSWLVSHVGVDGQSMLSRAVSKHKSAREARTRLVDRRVLILTGCLWLEIRERWFGLPCFILAHVCPQK